MCDCLFVYLLKLILRATLFILFVGSGLKVRARLSNIEISHTVNLKICNSKKRGGGGKKHLVMFQNLFLKNLPIFGFLPPFQFFIYFYFCY